MQYKANKLIVLIALLAVSSSAFLLDIYQTQPTFPLTADSLRLDEQEATIRAIKKVQPSVVSIIVYDQEQVVSLDLDSGERTTGKRRVEKGSGTGFIISADGLILTNKHVVESASEKTAEFRIILNSGKEYYAQLIGKDPVNDLAVLKIFDKNLPAVEIGNSAKLDIGSAVIAIGNALGRYQNSATKGIISGIGRSIMASDQTGRSEGLDNLLQTDADINPGNSGGPLIDLAGKVIGISTAIDESGSGVGFAIPIGDAAPVIRSVKEQGRIVRPRLGLRYIMLTPEESRDNNLARTSGAWVVPGKDGSPAVQPDTPAYRAGVKEGDIIYEINAIPLSGKNTLLSVVQKYKPGNRIGLKIQRGKEILTLIVTLDEFK